MTSEVLFTDMSTKRRRNLLDKTREIFNRAGLGEVIDKGDMVAVKVHFGETGNIAFLPPPLVRVVVEEIKKRGGKPFVTDANTLYSGTRRNAIDHLETAFKNGFTYETVGAPIIIADGLKGQDYTTVEINGDRLKEVKISSAVHYADCLIVMSHVKGHDVFGFGGALKNTGMGCGAPAGKQVMHSDMKPKVKEEKCAGCKICVDRCPASAISLLETKKAVIDSELCIGCGECVAFCPQKAIPINWKTDDASVQERTAEYAWGVIKHKMGKCGFINFVMNVSPGCDCLPWNDTPIVPNQGILASKDPVAIDQASVDLINDAPLIGNSVLAAGGKGRVKDKIRAISNKPWHYILDHGEKLGMGTRKYMLKPFWLRGE